MSHNYAAWRRDNEDDVVTTHRCSSHEAAAESYARYLRRNEPETRFPLCVSVLSTGDLVLRDVIVDAETVVKFHVRRYEGP